MKRKNLILGLAVLVAVYGVIGTSQASSSQKHPKVWKASTPLEELGYHLYFEKRFSADNTISCNTCHNVLNQGNGAQDTPVAEGINGQKGGRNSPTVWNAVFLSTQFWDGRAKDLAEQSKGPITNPIEMGMKDHDSAIDKIKDRPGYKKLFARAFPGQKNPFIIDNVAQAIAAFESTLTTLDSPYDKEALSKLAQQGQKEFQTLGCVACHSGPHFAGPKLPVGTGFFMKFPTFPDKALEKKYGFSKDPGRFEVTKKDSDKNFWRVPTLRNVALTAPYFHNGSVPDLKTAIRVMGKLQLNKDLSDDQVQSIHAFLESLTGSRPLIRDPKPL